MNHGFSGHKRTMKMGLDPVMTDLLLRVLIEDHVNLSEVFLGLAGKELPCISGNPGTTRANA